MNNPKKKKKRQLTGQHQTPASSPPPQEVPRYSGAVDCDVRGGEEHRVEHQGGHDRIQELIRGVGVGLLFLLLSVCMGLKQEEAPSEGRANMGRVRGWRLGLGSGVRG